VIKLFLERDLLYRCAAVGETRTACFSLVFVIEGNIEFSLLLNDWFDAYWCFAWWIGLIGDTLECRSSLCSAFDNSF